MYTHTHTHSDYSISLWKYCSWCKVPKSKNTCFLWPYTHIYWNKHPHKSHKRLSGCVSLCKPLQLTEFIERSAASYQEVNEVQLVVSGIHVYSLIRNIQKNQTVTVLCSFNTCSFITEAPAGNLCDPMTVFLMRPQQSKWRLLKLRLLTSNGFA